MNSESGKEVTEVRKGLKKEVWDLQIDMKRTSGNRYRSPVFYAGSILAVVSKNVRSNVYSV